MSEEMVIAETSSAYFGSVHDLLLILSKIGLGEVTEILIDKFGNGCVVLAEVNNNITVVNPIQSFEGCAIQKVIIDRSNDLILIAGDQDLPIKMICDSLAKNRSFVQTLRKFDGVYCSTRESSGSEKFWLVRKILNEGTDIYHYEELPANISDAFFVPDGSLFVLRRDEPGCVFRISRGSLRANRYNEFEMIYNNGDRIYSLSWRATSRGMRSEGIGSLFLSSDNGIVWLKIDEVEDDSISLSMSGGEYAIDFREFGKLIYRGTAIRSGSWYIFTVIPNNGMVYDIITRYDFSRIREILEEDVTRIVQIEVSESDNKEEDLIDLTQ